MKENKVKIVLLTYIGIIALTSFALPLIFDTLVPNCFENFYYSSFLLVQLFGFELPIVIALFGTRIFDEKTGKKHISFTSVIPRFEEVKLVQILTTLLIGITAFYGFEFIKNGIELFVVAYFPEYKYISDFSRVSIKTFFAMVTLFAIIPSVFEEILYRGIFFDTFKKNKVCLYFITTLAFAAAHKGLISFFSAIFVGLITMQIMVKTKQIILPIMMHFIYNICCLVHSGLFENPLSPKFQIIRQSNKIDLMSMGCFNLAISVVFLTVLWIVLAKLKGFDLTNKEFCVQVNDNSSYSKKEKVMIVVFLVLIVLSIYVINIVLI